MQVRELMTPEPDVVTPQDTLETVARIMRDRDVGAVPVVDDRVTMRPRGIITDRDIAVRHVAEGHDPGCTITNHMTQSAIETVDENDDVEKVMQVMKRAGVRRVPVTGRGGKLVGIVSQADLARNGNVEKEEVGEVVGKISEPAGVNR